MTVVPGESDSGVVLPCRCALFLPSDRSNEALSTALGTLANVYRDQARLAESAAHHRQARDIYRQTGGRGGEGQPGK